MKKHRIRIVLASALCLCLAFTAILGGRTVTPAAAADAQPYADVAANAWYATAVDYVKQQGLMLGTGNDKFSPEETFTRAQLATVLYRIAGEPAVSGEDGFSDTASGTWYANAVLWAEQQGVVNGIGKGLFGTNEPVTQEQMATMLWRMEKEPDAADASDASSYAAKAVGWAREKSIAPATAAYTFAPKQNASRAQIAALLHGYLTRRSAPSTSVSGGPTVYFTSEITPESLIAVYEKLGWNPTGKVAVKVSTGEPPASNYLRAELIGGLVKKVNGTIVECNTAYGGSRSESEMHKQVAADHGFTSIAPFDLMDEEGEIEWPVTGGKRLDRIIVGSHATNYPDWLVLSHYKGHAMAGFGGAIKNVGIGASSASGKVLVHSAGTRTSGSIMHRDQDAWLEALAEMVDGFVDHVGKEHIVYVSVMNRISVDCDCNGNPREPDIHDIGILASLDPVALDQACFDLVSKAEGNESLLRRIENRHGLHTLEHAEEIGLGTRSYTLVNIDAK